MDQCNKAILVIDLVESVRLMSAHEVDTVSNWLALSRYATQITGNLGGRIVKSLGDGLLAEFDHPQQAIDTAQALHEHLRLQQQHTPASVQMWLRAGIHVAPLFITRDDVYGHGVNLTARITSLAAAGETIVSEAARNELGPTQLRLLDDLGPCYLKHLDEPVRVFRLAATGRRLAVKAREIRPTVAVLPFSHRGARQDESADVLGELIADGVIARLGRSNHLHVLSRFSADQAQAFGRLGPQTLADYDVTHVLSGSCTQVAGKLIISFELTEVQSHKLVSSERFYGTVDDLLRLDSEACQRIADVSQQQLLANSAEQSLQAPMPTLPSHALLLGGVSLMHRAEPGDFSRSHDVMQALIDRHPRAAASRSWMAKWYVLNLTRGYSRNVQAEAIQAMDQTRRALEAEPENSQALAVAGFVQLHLQHDLDQAERTLSAALQANPNDPWALLFMGVLNAFRDRGAQAVRLSQQALHLSPHDPMRYYFLSLAATCSLSNQEHSDALELCQASIRLNQAHASTWRTLISAYVGLGLIEQARQAARQLLQLSPEYSLEYFRKHSASLQSAGGKRVYEALKIAGIPEKSSGS